MARWSLLVFVLCVVLYVATSYGGVRSPDSEIVFRTGESLLTRGTFAVERELEIDRRFGLADGRDGRRYSIFGPLQSVAIVPGIGLARIASRTGWYDDTSFRIPISHYVGDGLIRFLTDRAVELREPHATRFLLSFFNVLVGAVTGVLFFLLVRLLTGSDRASVLTTLLFCFGTLAWPYSGTFFSEPLATALLVASVYLMIAGEPARLADERRRVAVLFGSGLLLGLSTAAHVTGILFAPFFFAYVVWTAVPRNDRRSYVPALAFAAGLLVVLCMIGIYNGMRFGNPLETGRSDPEYAFITFVAPWRGLVGLTLSSAKGLLVYCPMVALGIASWWLFHRRYPALSLALATCVLFRVVFIASRSDWHGGFSLGPRYLVPILPILILPIGVLVAGLLERKARLWLSVIGVWTVACIVQQAYLCSGEIFAFFHFVKLAEARRGVNVLADNLLYTDWQWSPMLNLLRVKVGPFVFRNLGTTAHQTWSILSVVSVTVIGAAAWPALRSRPSRRGASDREGRD